MAPIIPSASTTPLGEQKGVGSRRIAFGAEALPVDVTYLRMPANRPTADEPSQSPVWRVQLQSESGQIIGMDIYDDTILGRGEELRVQGGLDLTEWGAAEKGVSRQHLLLRPTSNRLYLIDLDSTNGTLHNSVPLGPGIARAVSDGDVVVLGNLAFVLRVVEPPADRQDAEQA